MWPTMNANFSLDEDSSASEEGTAAHWAAWQIKAGLPCPEGTIAPNGLVVTDEMIDGANLLIETINTRMPAGTLIYVEELIAIPQIEDECSGTPDVWGMPIETHAIEIVDYKFGHAFVDEYFNPQGLMYLLGILNRLNATNWKANFHVDVNFTIVQPRCFYRGTPVRTHSFKVGDAAQIFEDLKWSADAARDPQPEATTNSECGTCPGRHKCAALQHASYQDAEYSNNRHPLDIAPADAALELRILSRALARLEARVDGLKQLTLTNIQRGHPVPYFHIEQGKGRKQWNVPPDQVISVGELFGKDLSKPGIITPTQAAKLGIDDAVISAYSYSPAGSLKLVQDNPSDARKVFGSS
jgi:hypothetical protein